MAGVWLWDKHSQWTKQRNLCAQQNLRDIKSAAARALRSRLDSNWAYPVTQVTSSSAGWCYVVQQMIADAQPYFCTCTAAKKTYICTEKSLNKSCCDKSSESAIGGPTCQWKEETDRNISNGWISEQERQLECSVTQSICQAAKKIAEHKPKIWPTAMTIFTRNCLAKLPLPVQCSAWCFGSENPIMIQTLCWVIWVGSGCPA